jgi:hypothetical protein
MQLFTPPEPSRASVVAASMMQSANQQLNLRVGVQRNLYDAFWNDSTVTPDAILAELGSGAQQFVAVASENVEHITTLASFFGKTLADFVPTESWEPRRAFVPGDNGTVTLAAPAEGFDAWGKPIPEPEPEP